MTCPVHQPAVGVGRLMPKTLDDEYDEYLWGETSPRAFARRTKFGGTTNDSQRISDRYRNGVPR